MIRIAPLLAFALSVTSVLSLPTGSAGGDFVDSFLEERARVPVIAGLYYSSLIAFGASYTDNAHSRASQYASSLRNYYPYSSYGGRYTNGPVAVEYMVSTGTTPNLLKSKSAVGLLDYAYGGSQIDNSLTYGTSPATGDQITQYLSDVTANTQIVGTAGGRALHYINTGINPLTAIWLDAYNAGLTQSAISNAQSRVTQNANALFAQIRKINALPALMTRPGGMDFLIAGIPPLEIVPTFSYQCNGNTAALALLKTLSTQYNSALTNFVTQFRSEMTGTNGVFHYDMASLFYDMNSNPSNYGITASPVTKTCYSSSTGGVCSNPSQYLYWDSLHPVTSVMSVMASQMNTLVNARKTT